MNATIYIREENEEAWENIPNKSAWVNERLEDSPHPRMAYDSDKKEVIGKPVAEILEVKPAKDYIRSNVVEVDDGFKFCKHDAVIGMCKKGCK